MNNRRNRAFTLIELVVVILILGILAALIVPRVIQRGDDARIARATSDISTLAGQLQQFRMDCGRYPTTEEGLEALRTAPSDVVNQWHGPYLDKEIPLDPWSRPYNYVCPGTDGPNSFTITSLGASGQAGAQDNITDTRE